MSLYPSLEDMKVDHMMRAQTAQAHASRPAPPPPAALHPSAPHAGTVYPSLGTYMGLELSSDVIALNMPEYQLQPRAPNAVSHLIAPISHESSTLQKATVTTAIRPVTLCKDRDGKVGLRVHAVNDGVFVCYVAEGSPAALGGLRFGDQLLEINGVALAGMSADRCHTLLRKAPVNGINIAVRDRPFERTVTLHKDSLGHVGFHFKDGRVTGLVKDSSAARNGLLTDHQLVEINTRNVAGLKDKDIARVIDESPAIVNVTIVPHYIYKHMTSKMATSLLRESMDRTPAV